MSLISFDNLGQYGIIKALSDYELIPNAWSDASNVRFENNKVMKTLGYSTVFDPPSIVPYYLMHVPDVSGTLWLYGGLTAVYCTDMSSHFNISGVSAPYSAGAGYKWNGGILGGIPIINNTVDVPQMWTPVSTSQVLQDLSNWPSGYTAKLMRPFQEFMVAFDITKSGIRYPMMALWSHPADPGAVPSSWDVTDATKDAGEIDLAATPGRILDSVPFGQINFVYKESSIYTQQYVGGNTVIGFRLLHDDFGLLATDCAINFRKKHFCVTSDDILLHAGGEPTSLLTNRWRRELFNLIDPGYYDRSFVIPNIPRHEIWFCFPTVGDTQPTVALTWNWDTGALSYRELNAEIAFAAIGSVDPSAASQAWDSDSDTWDSDTTIWDAQSYDPANTRILMADSENTEFHFMDYTNQFNGSNMTAYVERTGLAIVGRKRDGNYIADTDSIKYVKRVIPRVRGSGTLYIYVGYQDTIDGAVTWANAVPYVIGTDYEALFDVVGKFIAIKFESRGNVEWELDGYKLDVEIVGSYQ